MKLINILSTQPQSELVSRVKKMKLVCNPHSRQEVTEELSKVILNKERAVREWENMNGEEKQLLLQMCYRATLTSFSSNEILTYLKRSDQEKYTITLDSLRDKGWIYREGNDSWLLPLELKNWVREFTSDGYRKEFVFFPGQNVRHGDIINDLFQFMDYISIRTIRLTKNRTIYKSELIKILNQLSKKEEIPKDKWRFGYGQHFYNYPDCFSFLYDFCMEQGWIAEGKTLEVTSRWEKGQTISVNELQERLLYSYIRLYKRAIPQLPFLVELVKQIFPEKEGIEKQQLIKMLKIFIDPYYFDLPETVIEKRVIQMLEYVQVLTYVEIDCTSYVLIHPRFTKKNKRKKYKKI